MYLQSPAVAIQHPRTAGEQASTARAKGAGLFIVYCLLFIAIKTTTGQGPLTAAVKTFHAQHTQRKHTDTGKHTHTHTFPLDCGCARLRFFGLTRL